MNTLPYPSAEENTPDDSAIPESSVENTVLDGHQPGPDRPESWNYEATIAKIEAITQQIESGDLPLADVLDQFAEAVAYLNQCEAFLSEKKEQVNLLIEVLSDEPE